MGYHNWKIKNEKQKDREIQKQIEFNKSGKKKKSNKCNCISCTLGIVDTYEYLKAENWRYKEGVDFNRIEVLQHNTRYTFETVSAYERALFDGTIPVDKKNMPWACMMDKPTLYGHLKTVSLHFKTTKAQNQADRLKFEKGRKEREQKYQKSTFNSIDEAVAYIRKIKNV